MLLGLLLVLCCLQGYEELAAKNPAAYLPFGSGKKGCHVGCCKLWGDNATVCLHD